MTNERELAAKLVLAGRISFLRAKRLVHNTLDRTYAKEWPMASQDHAHDLLMEAIRGIDPGWGLEE